MNGAGHSCHCCVCVCVCVCVWYVTDCCCHSPRETKPSSYCAASPRQTPKATCAAVEAFMRYATMAPANRRRTLTLLATNARRRGSCRVARAGASRRTAAPYPTVLQPWQPSAMRCGRRQPTRCAVWRSSSCKRHTKPRPRRRRPAMSRNNVEAQPLRPLRVGRMPRPKQQQMPGRNRTRNASLLP
jgi:hypothetical protein